MITLYNGDCLIEMDKIPDGSVDMILTDLPYGTTSCSWDEIIPFEPLWEQYNRVIKDNGAIVLTSTQPFTTKLINSNIDNFSYTWYWKKNTVTGFANAKKQPLRHIEDVVVFYKKPPTYNPQGVQRLNKVFKNGGNVGGETLRKDISESANKGSLRTKGNEYVQEFTNYPKQLLSINAEPMTVHPTQKPVELLEYLIKTYTNKGEVVLDSTMGSGSTGVACKRTDRRFIGIELDKDYFKIAKERIDKPVHIQQGLDI